MLLKILLLINLIFLSCISSRSGFYKPIDFSKFRISQIVTLLSTCPRCLRLKSDGSVTFDLCNPSEDEQKFHFNKSHQLPIFNYIISNKYNRPTVPANFDTTNYEHAEFESLFVNSNGGFRLRIRKSTYCLKVKDPLKDHLNYNNNYDDVFTTVCDYDDVRQIFFMNLGDYSTPSFYFVKIRLYWYKNDSSSYINPKNQEIIDTKFSLSVYKNDVGNSSNNVAVNLDKDYIFSAMVYPGYNHAFSISCSDSDYYYPEQNNSGIFRYFANCHDNPPVPIVYLPILEIYKATLRPGYNLSSGKVKSHAFFFIALVSITIESVKTAYESWPAMNSKYYGFPTDKDYKYTTDNMKFENKSFSTGETFVFIANAFKTDKNSYNPGWFSSWKSDRNKCYDKYSSDILLWENGVGTPVITFWYAFEIEGDGKNKGECLASPSLDFVLKIIPPNFASKSHNDLMRDKNEY